MTVEKARQFVYSGSGTFLSIDSVLFMIWCYVFFAFWATAMGVVVGGGSLVLCICIDFFVVLYAVAAFILRAKWNAYVFSVRFWVNGCSSTFSSVFFLFFTIQLLISGDGSRGSPYIPLYIGLLVVGYFVFVSGLFLFIVYRIRNRKHDASPSKSTQSSVAYFIVGGVSVGVGLVRVFIHSVSQETVTVIVVTFGFILALLCSLGSANFIKCFLIAKYQFESDGLEELILDQLKESREGMSLMGLVKKFLLVLLAIFVLFMVIGFIGFITE